jgi:hypothetical protein
MTFFPFSIVSVGDCFCVGSALAALPFEDHVLRKVDGLHAEYVDGSGRVLIPEGTLVRPLEAALS